MKGVYSIIIVLMAIFLATSCGSKSSDNASENQSEQSANDPVERLITANENLFKYYENNGENVDADELSILFKNLYASMKAFNDSNPTEEDCIRMKSLEEQWSIVADKYWEAIDALESTDVHEKVDKALEKCGFSEEEMTDIYAVYNQFIYGNESLIEDSNWDDEMIPITQQKEIVAPPPAAAPKVAEIINIVENETELVEEEVQTSEEVNQPLTSNSSMNAPYEETNEETIYERVEKMAEFPGGEEACLKWINDHLIYPESALEQGLQGRINVSFVVNKDGSLTDIRVLRSPDESMSEEAERLVRAMPKWKPARNENKIVRSRFILPITFRNR